MKLKSATQRDNFQTKHLDRIEFKDNGLNTYKEWNREEYADIFCCN